MRTEFYLFGVSILIAVAGAIGCQGEKASPSPGSGDSSLADIDLDLDLNGKTASGPGTPVEAADGLFSRIYEVPPNFLKSAPGGSRGGAAAADPFAAPSSTGSEQSTGVRTTGQGVLEAYGVTFPHQAGATYNPETNELTVVATSDQFDLVDAVLESLQQGSEKMINIRIEIFELPARHALKLQQSSEKEDDHSPEWKAVLGLFEKGGARFITSAGILARSGQRAKFEDSDVRIHVADYRWVNEKTKERMVPKFEERAFGTFLEVDPVLGPDDMTIDLNLSLEHHTASPTDKTELVRFPNTDRSIEVSTPEFHVKKVTTQVTLIDGYVKLLAVWRPTGKAEFEASDVMRVAFLKADVVPAFRVGRIR